MAAVPAVGTEQAELAAGAPGADGERGAGQQADLQDDEGDDRDEDRDGGRVGGRSGVVRPGAVFVERHLGVRRRRGGDGLRIGGDAAFVGRHDHVPGDAALGNVGEEGGGAEAPVGGGRGPGQRQQRARRAQYLGLVQGVRELVGAGDAVGVPVLHAQFGPHVQAALVEERLGDRDLARPVRVVAAQEGEHALGHGARGVELADARGHQAGPAVHHALGRLVGEDAGAGREQRAQVRDDVVGGPARGVLPAVVGQMPHRVARGRLLHRVAAGRRGELRVGGAHPARQFLGPGQVPAAEGQVGGRHAEDRQRDHGDDQGAAPLGAQGVPARDAQREPPGGDAAQRGLPSVRSDSAAEEADSSTTVPSRRNTTRSAQAA